MADRVIKPDSGNQLVLQDEGGSASLTIETDGDVSLTQDIYLASGKGIYFDGGTTAANYLGGSDAYEEGTWTPVLANHASAGTTLSGTANGFYTKIGRTVFISGRFACSNLNSATGDLVLRGLPFTVKNSTGCDSAFSIGYATGLSMTLGETVVWNVQKGLTIAYAMDWSDTAGQGFFQCEQFTASGIFTWSGHYFI